MRPPVGGFGAAAILTNSMHFVEAGCSNRSTPLCFINESWQRILAARLETGLAGRTFEAGRVPPAHGFHRRRRSFPSLLQIFSRVAWINQLHAD